MAGHETVGWSLVEEGGQLHLPDIDKTTPWQYYLLNRKNLAEANTTTSSPGDLTQRSVRFRDDAEVKVHEGSESEKGEDRTQTQSETSTSGVSVEGSEPEVDHSAGVKGSQGFIQKNQDDEDSSSPEIQAATEANCESLDTSRLEDGAETFRSEDGDAEESSEETTKDNRDGKKDAKVSSKASAASNKQGTSDKRRQKSGHHKTAASQSASKSGSKMSIDKGQGKKQTHGQGHRLSFGQELEFMPSLRRNSKSQKLGKKEKDVGETPRSSRAGRKSSTVSTK